RCAGAGAGGVAVPWIHAAGTGPDAPRILGRRARRGGSLGGVPWLAPSPCPGVRHRCAPGVAPAAHGQPARAHLLPRGPQPGRAARAVGRASGLAPRLTYGLTYFG